MDNNNNNDGSNRLLLNSKHYYIDLINSSKAYQFTSMYHYSGVGFKKATLNQGIFRKTDNMLVGVLQWGCSAQSKIKLSRYVKEPIETSQYLELNRFCMTDCEGKNAESEAISLGMKWIRMNRKDIKLLVSYAGRKEGNYGYIYQATNWEYLGYFISNGFWLLDGQEKHQMTLWCNYQRHGSGEGLQTWLVHNYHDVRQTWSKQFIYIQRLDKSLTPASEILPYPKPTSEPEICTRVKIYQEDNEYLKAHEVKPTAPKYVFYYEKDEQLFSRNALLRRGELNVSQIAIYDSTTGALIDVVDTLAAATKITGLSATVIRGALKNDRVRQGYYFKKFTKSDGGVPPKTCDSLPYICKIDGILFYSQSDVAEYCGVSRQAVSGSRQRKSHFINDREIEWA